MCWSAITSGSILRYLLVIIDELWEIHPTELNEDTQTECCSCTYKNIQYADEAAQGTSGPSLVMHVAASQVSHCDTHRFASQCFSGHHLTLVLWPHVGPQICPLASQLQGTVTLSIHTCTDYRLDLVCMSLEYGVNILN